VSRLGNIGCFLSGAGIFLFALQYMLQIRSMDISQNNEHLIRVWNVSTHIDNLLADFTKYKNNRDRIAGQLRAKRTSINTVIQDEKIHELKLDNNLLIKSIYNKISTLDILLEKKYVDRHILSECKDVFIELKNEFVKRNLSLESIDSLLPKS
jgi:hypothetical protein